MILLTGATGYIGSHTWVELLNSGHEVVGIDNLSNSNEKVLARVESITNIKPNFVRADIRNIDALREIFQLQAIDCVVHFAALKAVGESVEKPLEYYDNNINGLLQLLQACNEFSCKQFVFSSSATVYHPQNQSPYFESMSLGPINPYGWTKMMSEQILQDYAISLPGTSVAYLRYFNPVGAHASGLIGENPLGTPNNLMPYIAQVAVGRREFLSIYGGDWPTVDGTGVRDYIHVVDLAKGHVAAIDYLTHQNKSLTVNLGTGVGTSVLELVHAFEIACKRKIPYQLVSRRVGDIAVSYANTDLAKKLMGWSAHMGVEQMCQDVWRWQSMNPKGYE
jgi:UDP-glucose 4-epimerase